jgi:hypothetical protein
VTKRIVGKNSCLNNKFVGNGDCKLNEVAMNIIPLVGKNVHAVRVEDDIRGDLKRDTMYVSPQVTINLRVIRSINTVLDPKMPGYYQAMEEHMNKNPGHNEFCNMSGIKLSNSLPSHNAIAIKVNGIIAGYYLPDLNSWLTGFWTWHVHYINIILSQIFPQIVEQLDISSCPDAINDEIVKKLTVSMGADPELEVLKNGKVINAQAVIDCDNHHLTTEIGLDGQQAQLEFRPKPGNPREVTKNIRKLVKEFSIKYPDFDLSDSGNHYPLGGHIHVGVGHEIMPSSELRMILDDFVGRPTIDMSGDARSSYKKLGAVREQNHGFEYRSTPAAVFQNPAIAYIVLKLVKNLCEKYLNQEVLEYSDVPTLQDYMTVGGLTKNQAKYFTKFCSCHKPTQSIRSSWKVPPAKISSNPAYSLDIEFRDEWHRGVSTEIRESLLSIGIETKQPILVSLYGLSAERGDNTSTIQLNNCRRLPVDSIPKPIWRDNVLNIGFSIDMRVGGIRNSQIRELIREIQSQLMLHEVLA